MHYVLSGLGGDLTNPLEAAVLGGIADAMREADAILEREPTCEAVEIFADGKFLGDIARKLS
jgi:hypothetical protein